MISEKEFLKTYNIAKVDFDKTNIKWEDLIRIFDHYSKSINSFEQTAKDIAERLRMNSKVHSVKFRVKTPEHLVAKIIRKRVDEPNREITISNYTTEITDIVGVRALHLFKSDWIEIHNYIIKGWDQNEPPTANIRKGDLEDEYKSNKCEIKEHRFGYRSVHYLIKSMPMKEITISEIQVRTIFEEGWSEIDHEIRYPYKMDNEVLSGYLGIFNRFAGGADEMGTFLKELQRDLNNKEKLIGESQKKIRELQSLVETLKIDKETKRKLETGIKELQLGNEFQSWASSLYFAAPGLGKPVETTLFDLVQKKREIHQQADTVILQKRCTVCKEMFTPSATSVFSDRCSKHQRMGGPIQ